MFRNIRDRFRQLHKRNFYLTLLFLVLAAAMSVVILLAAVFNLDRVTATGRITITPEGNTSKAFITGVGLNLSELPDNNLVRDGSFEPEVFSVRLHVEEGTQSAIYAADSAGFAGSSGIDVSSVEGYFNGALARIVTLEGDKVKLRKAGRVASYEPFQLTKFSAVKSEGDFDGSENINDIVEFKGVTYGVCDKGLVATNLQTQSPTVFSTGFKADLIAVAADDNNLYAVAVDGTVISTTDGSMWNRWIGGGKHTATSATVSGNRLVVGCYNGIILVGENGKIYPANTGAKGNITEIIYVDKGYLACTDMGELLYSQSGLLWNIVYSEGSSYKKICSDGSHIYAVSEIGYDTFSIIGSNLLSRVYTSFRISDFYIMKEKKIFALDTKGIIHESDDSGASWITPTNQPSNQCDSFFVTANKEFLAVLNLSSIRRAKLLTKVELDSDLSKGNYEAGDICFLSLDKYPDIKPGQSMISRENIWENYGPGNVKIVAEHVSPKGGYGVLRISTEDISGNADDITSVSQVLKLGDRGDGFAAGEQLYCSLWMRQEGSKGARVFAWVDGKNIKQGETFTNIGTTWNKYTFKIKIPLRFKYDNSSPIRLTIACEGKATLFLDKIYLGKSEDSEFSVASDFTEKTRKLQPTIVRMNFMDIGKSKRLSGHWAIDGSLERGLKYVYSLGDKVSPWLVIDSYASESEIENLIEYLAGPISSSYGNLRFVNGAAIPWATLFSRIYIEFKDTENNFRSDSYKALFVNSCISAIQESFYYQNLRNNIVFVDGMEYKEGIMLSEADFSSVRYESNIESMPLTLDGYTEESVKLASLIPRTPDRPYGNLFSFAGEVIMPMNSKNASLKDYVFPAVAQLGKTISGALVDFPYNRDEATNKLFASSVEIISNLDGMKSMGLAVSSVKGNKPDILYYGFEDSNKYVLIIMSVGNNVQPVLLNSFNYGKGSIYSRYDSSGNIVEKNSLKRSSTIIRLYQGNVVRVEIMKEK